MGWDSKIIEWFSHSPFSHVEHISDDLTMTFGAQLKGGVKWRSVTDPCYAKVGYVEVWQIPIAPAQLDLLNAFIRETDGALYDEIEIAGFGLNERNWSTPGRYICSKWSVVAKERMGLIHIPPTLTENGFKPSDDYLVTTMFPTAKRIV